ncbi:hypothetical protein MLD38_001594 [Melastoma candidum]|uniref:Uncharacterized protein n=1 Tax=Melastoma candidum TaxID=119954 RepID=A0ACB9SMC9_9MYRT|nr:hypothetical protein MLD38_001594 [Melastoma candidum]
MGEPCGEGSGDEEYATLSVPRGGPIFVPYYIGALTRVPEFENSIVRLLEELKAEVSSESPVRGEGDLSVDELKIFSDSELVEMAMKEALAPLPEKDAEVLVPVPRSEEGGMELDEPKGCLAICDKAFPGTMSVEDSHSSFESKLILVKGKNVRKRKGKRQRQQALEVSFIQKVEDIVKIKRRQDEDKGRARLHSLTSISKTDDTPTAVGERGEKLQALRLTNHEVKVKVSDLQDNAVVSHPEIILCVEVYHHVRKWSKSQEFLVLGHQLLTELRDKIYCTTDHVMEKAGQHDPSGYFLIEDLFCNDMRDRFAIDYSEPILDWLRNSKDEALEKWESILTGELQPKQKNVIGPPSTSQVPHFNSIRMEKTRFYDLKFQLGAGYLYCHQGDCKHTIVIRDMRLIHGEDIRNRAAYPILVFQIKGRVRKCNVCKIYRATKVTVDDKWAKDNPCYFCDNCYYLLHYSQNNTLLYSDFSVYDYHHD